MSFFADENLKPVEPEKPLTIRGDGKYTQVYVNDIGELVFSIDPYFIERFEYVEKMVKALTAPNREKYPPKGYPNG
jgi:hypothetical protein